MKEIYRKVHQVIKDVWLYDIKNDYNNYFLLKEDTLKNAFYYHLRNRLGDTFIRENNLAIFTEYRIDTEQKIDLVVVELDTIKAKTSYLGDCVTKVIAVIEIKYKGKYAPDEIFNKDINKVLAYSKMFQDEDSKFYVAFVREKYFRADEVTHFLPDSKKSLAKNKIVEMLAYWVSDDDSTQWVIKEH